MAEESLVIGIQPDTRRGARTISRDLDDIKRRARDVERGTDRVGRTSRRSFQDMARGTDVASRGIRGLVNQVKILGATMVASLGVGAIIRTADAFTELTNRLRVAGVAAQDMSETQGELFEIANRNGVAINSLAQLYSRASIAAEELGTSEEKLMDFVRGTAAALRVQGGSAAASSGALLQLSQALGSGVVRAEEFNSILEGAFPIAQAAARGIERMEGSVAKLRSEILEGNVTSREFFEGLLRGFTATEAQAAGMQLTVGQALTTLNNSFTMFVGAMDEATGLSGGLSSAIQALGRGMDALTEHLENVVKWAKVAGVALLTAFSGTILGAVRTLSAAILTGLVGAIRAVGVAIAANPLGALLTGIVTVITAVWQFRDTIEQVFGVDVEAKAKQGANAIVNTQNAAFAAVTEMWDRFPEILGGAAIEATNAVNSAMNRMVQKGIDGINRLIEGINDAIAFMGADRALEFFGFSGRIPTIPDAGGIPEIVNPFRDTMDELQAIIDREMGREWFGGASESANEAAQSVESLLSRLDETATAAAGAGGAGKAAAEEMGGGLDSVLEKARQVADDGWNRVGEEARRAAEETARFWRRTTGGFMRDLRSGIEQGKGLWRSFADAATRAIDRITDRLLNQMLDAIFEVSGAATGGGGGGGLFSSIGSFIGGLFGSGGGGGGSAAGTYNFATNTGGLYAKGGAFDRQGEITRFARGDVFDEPSLFRFAQVVPRPVV